MMVPMLGVVLLLIAALISLLVWRQSDHRADDREMARLLATQPAAPATFDPAMVETLPEPARRYFLFAIRPGTPLHTVAEIEMTGQFSLGTKEAPNFLPMRARQVLASPHGFVWAMDAGSFPMAISGSDSGGWTRFWLGGFLPVARVEADADTRRSAFGRHVAEAAFWTPAVLLPGPGVSWEGVDANTARAIVTHGDLSQAIEVTVDAEGRATQVAFARWSNANPDKRWQVQPFGGTLSDYRDVGGFRLPTRVEAGNFFGTDAYFPFFIADVQSVRFPPAGTD
jgi:hypothetical protein